MNVKQSSKDDNIVINTLSDFIQNIEKLPKCLEGYDRFYRGQNIDLPLIPAVFRSDSLAKNESNIFHEIVNKKPEEFEKCKCTFDYLVKMQHYNIPTRLLDITSNPLVALFFACLDCEVDATPTVYCIDIPNSRIKNYTSDSVTILSVLARYNESYKNKTLKKIEECQSIWIGAKDKIVELIMSDLCYVYHYREAQGVCEESQNEIFDELSGNEESDVIVKFSEFITDKIEVLQTVNSNDTRNKLKKIFCKLFENVISDTYFKFKNEGKDATRSDLSKTVENLKPKQFFLINDAKLLHEVKQDKPYFLDQMEIGTFQFVFCVKPRLDNPRIVRQTGAFLLFPDKSIKLADGLNYFPNGNVSINKLSINRDKVQVMIEKLKLLNISEEYLYADMDTVSKAIKEKYTKKD